jgi:hypothetical protein
MYIYLKSVFLTLSQFGTSFLIQDKNESSLIKQSRKAYGPSVLEGKDETSVTRFYCINAVHSFCIYWLLVLKTVRKREWENVPQF